MLLLRALPPALLLLSFAAAQSCYYPDGQSISTDVPCNGTASASACCASNSFCLDNGLCYGEGVTSRGSCTDKTWASPACAGYCKAVQRSASVYITPCTVGNDASTFVCGLNGSDCQSDQKTFVMSGGSLILRTSQIEELIGPALVTPAPTGFSTGVLAGVACGVAIPFLITAILLGVLLGREKKKRRTQPYIPHDDELRSKIIPSSPPTVVDNDSYRSFNVVSPIGQFHHEQHQHQSQQPESRSESRNSHTTSEATRKPYHGPRLDTSLRSIASSITFRERYEILKAKQLMIESDQTGRRRHELPSGDTGEVERFELATQRQSVHKESTEGRSS
ncbi:Hypothetical protein R9X50_00745900 [Acrodontium crateriforme]|uniref:Uncharacterized protein n=1 Tax=Acrodontium crateriforme TaxID=150365 RepID=A0AAQ3MBI0_9PEZI|nr:Hypothetical protein R9X50_00745900 [Acrodontium crateriforme]